MTTRNTRNIGSNGFGAKRAPTACRPTWISLLFFGTIQACSGPPESGSEMSSVQAALIDTSVCPSGANLLIGTIGDDVLTGGPGIDCIFGLEGNDQINGGAGNDILFGGDGNDTISGGPGSDSAEGGNGNDVIVGGNGKDTLAGGAGNDALIAGGANEMVDGGDGIDSCDTGSCEHNAGTPRECVSDTDCVVQGQRCLPGAGVCVHCQDNGECGDGNTCTEDSCQPFVGCAHGAVADGTACSDESACTAGDACQGGACSPGAPLACDDGNTCTDDACDPVIGCTHDSPAGGYDMVDWMTLDADLRENSRLASAEGDVLYTSVEPDRFWWLKTPQGDTWDAYGFDDTYVYFEVTELGFHSPWACKPPVEKANWKVANRTA